MSESSSEDGDYSAPEDTGRLDSSTASESEESEEERAPKVCMLGGYLSERMDGWVARGACTATLAPAGKPQSATRGTDPPFSWETVPLHHLQAKKKGKRRKVGPESFFASEAGTWEFHATAKL